MQSLIIVAAIVALTQAPPPTEAEQLQDAARKGDAAAVTKLIDDGVDVNTKFRYNATALFYACDHGHLDVVKVLLDKGADLTIKDTFYGFTPLMLAVSPAQKKRPEHTEIAKLLIAKGAPGKDNALSGAIESDDVVLVKFILDSGGIPAPKLSEALEVAKSQKKTEMASMLEKAGAKVPEEFKIDAAQLERFAGRYKNAGGNELIVVVNGARLALGPAAAPPDQRVALAAKDATTFRAIGMGGMSIVFKIEADKVTGFTLMPPQGSPVVYTRTEGK
jgi:Ankyrin repeats (3 copies)